VLVENVPISFVPENRYALADIEKKAGLKPGSIAKARYIKPESRRRQGQRTAHTVSTFKTKEDANQAIKFGLSVESKKVYGRNLIQEPTRCLKCHLLEGTHIAAECPQEQDICGSCGGPHRTSACSITDPNEYHCKNCDVKGHAAWSRDCPTFKKKWETHRARNKDAKYRFYLTEDPLTWEALPAVNQDRNSSNSEAETRQEPPSQPQQRYPPPRDRTADWHTVTRRREAPMRREHQNANRIPLGGQSRITDTWYLARQHPSQRPHHARNTEDHFIRPSTPSQWSQSPYGSPHDQYNPSSWDQDHNN